MNDNDCEKYLQSEAMALRYLLKFCWKNHQRFCPRCRHRKNYKLRDQRRRCARCAYTFHDFSGRWINNGDLSCRQWLRTIKLFAADLTVLGMSRELELAYNTVYKAVTTLRCAIAAGAGDARSFFGVKPRLFIPLQGRMFRADRTNVPPLPPVFGLTEHSHGVVVELLPGVHPETVFHVHHDSGLRLGNWGRIYFTSPFHPYDALVFCTQAPPPRFINLTMTLDDPPAGQGSFLGFALEHARRCKGLTPEKYPLYIKELEFRFNNRAMDLIPLIAELACGFVPNLE